MPWNPFTSVIPKLRRINFLKYYIRSNSNSSQSIHYVGGPAGFVGAMAGHDAGKNIAAYVHAVRSVSDAPLQTIVKSIIAVLGFLYIVIHISGFLFKISAVVLYFGGLFLFSVCYFLGWRDYKKHKKMKKLAERGSTQDVDEAIAYLSARHPETQLLAMQALRDVCQNSPGRLLKNATHEPQSLATIFVSKLSETNENILTTCSSIIKWLSRDHGKMFLPHCKTIAHHVDSQHAAVQMNLVIALGNIAQFDQKHHPGYAKAIAPAAKDLDSEVRKAAAIALGNVHCSESVTILEYLRDNDTAPEVAQEATNSLKKLQTQITV